jgi:hypothetical protein
LLKRPSPLNDPDQHHDNGDYQQNMDKSTDDKATDHSEQPQNQKNDGDSPKHVDLLTEISEHPTLKVSLFLAASEHVVSFSKVSGAIKRVNGVNCVFWS